MSRIFDALRQSERDKQPGIENWMPVPGALTNELGLDVGNEGVEKTELGALPSGEDSLNRSSSSAVDIAPSLSAEVASACSMKATPSASAVSSLATNEFAGGDTFPPIHPMIGFGSPQIELSKLKVVPVSSIPSPLLVSLSSDGGLGAEKYRVLGARLSNIRMGATLSVLQVTSSVVGEGKTLTSVNLAITLATRFAQTVLLAEGDLRKPAVCALLGIENHPGIGEWWEECDTPIGNFLLRIGDTGMCVLPAGDVAHPASVLQSSRISEMISGLAQQFDWVIIDTPPLLPMADSNLWSRVSDGTLMVVRQGAVSRAALKKAVESIDNPKLVGIVLNDAADYDKVNYYDRYYTPLSERASTRKAVSS